MNVGRKLTRNHTRVVMFSSIHEMLATHRTFSRSGLREANG